MSEGGFSRTIYIVVAVVLVAVAAFILFRPGDGVSEDTVDPIAVAGEDVSVVLGEEVRLDAGASSDDVGIVEYVWDLGDGSEAVGVAVVHAYDAAGIFTVTLTVRDGASNADADSLIVAVEEPPDEVPPVADAGPDLETLAEVPLVFDASGSRDDVGVVGYSWDFGDGETVGGIEVVHVYEEAGNYTVTLEVSDGAGNVATDTLEVVVVEPPPVEEPPMDDETPPVADAGLDQNGTVGEVILFDGSGSTDDVGVAGYIWNLGDGGSAEGVVVEHAYREAGNYTVTLVVVDEAGNSGADSLTVVVSAVVEDAAPVIDGRIDPDEYPHSLVIQVTGATIYWYNDAAEIYVGLVSPGTGWVAIGFDPVQSMRGANFVFCYVVDGEARVSDQFGTGTFSHTPDNSLGGTEDVAEYAGVEAEGGTVFEFRMPLVTGDPSDKPLVPGATYTVLNSLHMTSDNITSKHTRKGTFTMALDEAP